MKLALTLAAALLLPASPLRAASIFVPLTWIDNSDNEDGFRVEQNVDGGSWIVVAVTKPNVTKGTAFIVPDRMYCWRVVAFNSTGASSPSNVACRLYATQTK